MIITYSFSFFSFLFAPGHCILVLELFSWCFFSLSSEVSSLLFTLTSLHFFVAPQFEVGRSRVSKCLGVSSTVGRCKLDLLYLCGEGVVSCSFLEFPQSWAICNALGVTVCVKGSSRGIPIIKGPVNQKNSN